MIGRATGFIKKHGLACLSDTGPLPGDGSEIKLDTGNAAPRKGGQEE